MSAAPTNRGNPVPAEGRNRLVVPAVGAGILAVVVVMLLVFGGEDDDRRTDPAPATATTAAADASTDKLSGSGDAPGAIAIEAATVARSARGFGLAADLPDIDLKRFDSVTLVLGQDGGDVIWNLRTTRDARGAFITPELYRARPGPDEQFACAGSSIRIKATRLTATLPMACLDDPAKPLQARLEITDRDGGLERTSTSKVLPAPQG